MPFPLKVLAALTLAFLAGCASAPKMDLSPGAPKLVLEDFFAGVTRGEGALINRFTGNRTEFDVTITGSSEGDKLTLVEDFVFKDGAKDRKTWVLIRQPDGSYLGTREDVVGQGIGYEDGDAVRLEYVAEVSTGMGVLNMRFRDVLALEDAETLVNRANVSKWGLPVARVELRMEKAQ